MPPYDPKANRPKLVPVDDDVAPVDALLGLDAEPVEPVPARPHLSVVGNDDPVSRPAPEPAAPEPAKGLDPKKVLIAAVVIAAVLGLVAIVRRR